MQCSIGHFEDILSEETKSDTKQAADIRYVRYLLYANKEIKI